VTLKHESLPDTTIVNVALPSIGQGVKASSDAPEWVVSGYALTFGLALVPAGRLGDRFGHKQIFVAGLTVFTLASVGCGVAQNPAELIAARLVQGLGAGLYFPAISATIQRLFSGRDRSRAFGYLGGVVGISTAAGPLIGGLLIQFAGSTTAGGGYSSSTSSSARPSSRWRSGSCPAAMRQRSTGST
jgi:MFS family permease